MNIFDVGDVVYTFSPSGAVFPGMIDSVFSEDDELIYNLKTEDCEIICADASCVYTTREQATRACLQWKRDNLEHMLDDLKARRKDLCREIAKVDREIKKLEKNNVKVG